MKFYPLATGLLALALYAGPVTAQEQQPAEEPPAAEQPAAPAPEVAAPQVPQEILDFIADGRAVSELSDDELKSRARQARQFAKMDGLPPGLKDQLQGIAQSARAEIANREAAAAPPPAAEQPAPEQPAQADPAPAEQPAQTAQDPAADQPAAAAPAPDAPAEIPAAVTKLLADTRPASELSKDELNARAKQARKFAKMDGLPQDVRDQLKALAEAAHDEFVARQEKAKQDEQAAQPAPADVPADAPADAPPPAKTADAPADAPPPATTADAPADAPPPATADAPADAPPPAATTADAPADPTAPAAPAASADAVPPPPPAVIDVAPTAPLPPPPPAVAEAPANAPAAAAPPPAPVAVDKAQLQKLDGNNGNPEAEAKARAYLDDPQPADKLNDEQLRARLDGIRDLMAGNELSRESERALRQKLKTERDVLRNRVAVAEAQPPAQAAAPKPGTPPPSTARPPRNAKKGLNLSFEVVLNDRRPSDELEDYELRRRLEVYRQASYDRRYEEQQRNYWRAVMDRDQYLLQQRLLRERRQRQQELRDQYDQGQYDIELDDENYGRDERDDVYAAEVDDEELQDILIAPPRKKITRRYTVKEVEESPVLRASLPRVEIDTVHFGFNEAFVRAEEVSNLDRLAEIMERILTAHPREVFLIEGHTDAVGSDAANLALSRQRAEAIKKALTTYYVIPAKNLRTVGYGERYLKIPTAEAEQENRRVSVSRATALIGQADE